MIVVGLAFIISIVGLALLGILVARVRALGAEYKLKRFRGRDAGFADLLNYAAMVDDGVIVGKNGSFMAAWIFKGEDNASATELERETASKRINDAVARLGNGWMLHTDAVRRPAPGYPAPGLSEFADSLTRAMDEERRRLFERLGTLYEGYFIATLTWFPPALAQRRFVELMFDDDAVRPDRTARTMGLLKQFRREIAAFEARVSSALSLTRLHGRKAITEDGREVTFDDFLAWLQYCITGEHQPILLPSNPMYLDAVVGGQDFRTGVVPKIGNRFIQVVAIEGFPLDSAPGMLSSLAELSCSYRWSTRFIFLDQHESMAALEKFRKKWRQKVRGFFDQVFNTNTGAVNQDAVAMVGDAAGAIAEVSSGFVAAGYYTSVVVLTDTDRERVALDAIQVQKAINRLGFTARIETINTVEAYLGSLPGHGVQNVRRPLMNTMNLADLLPTSSIWTGSAIAPCPLYPPHAPPLMQCVTVGSTPFWLNFHVRDLGHAVVFGPTRSGKSTFLGIAAAQARRYARMRVFAFDKGLSMYALAAGVRAVTHGASGLHFNVAADDSRLAFCPLQFLETKADRAWAMEWIDTLLALNGLATTPEQRNSIARAILSMHETGSRTLSDFITTIQSNPIRSALEQYTGNGLMGHLLDADEDGLRLSDFTVFEISELMGLGDKYALPVLLYLFRRIERSLTGDPTIIFLDEAWVMLGHPVFREKIREWLKTLAKANCAVVLSTQSLSDAARSGIIDVIAESTATKIFLPNIYATQEESAAIYRDMGLNARQRELLAAATPKRDYYYVSENGRRLFELALGPLELAFVAVSVADVGDIRRLEAAHGDRWIYEWATQRGVDLAQYLETT